MEHTFTNIKKAVSGQDAETVVKRVEFTYEMSWKAETRLKEDLALAYQDFLRRQ